jgi:hypothetical protein
MSIRVVSLVTNLIMGGDMDRLLNFSRAVDRERFDHSVLTIVRPDSDDLKPYGPSLPHYQKHGITVEHLGEESRSRHRLTGYGLAGVFDDGRAFVRVVRRLARWLRERRVDIVDARMDMATILGVLAGRLAGVAAVVQSNDALLEFAQNSFFFLFIAQIAIVDRDDVVAGAHLEVVVIRGSRLVDVTDAIVAG